MERFGPLSGSGVSVILYFNASMVISSNGLHFQTY